MGREAATVLITVGLLLLLAGAATAYFGVRYETAQIPAVERSAMTDFDWIGAEWIARGGGILIVGVGLIIAGVLVRSRTRASDRHVA